MSIKKHQVSGEIITTDTDHLDLGRTQSADDQRTIEISHDYNSSQGAMIKATGTNTGDGTENGESLEGFDVIVPKKLPSTTYYYAVDDASLYRKAGAGSWSAQSLPGSPNNIKDTKGVSDTFAWVVGAYGSGGYIAKNIGAGYVQDTDHPRHNATGNIVYSVFPVSATEVWTLTIGSDGYATYYDQWVSGVGWTNKKTVPSGSASLTSKIYRVDTYIANVYSGGIYYSANSGTDWQSDGDPLSYGSYQVIFPNAAGTNFFMVGVKDHGAGHHTAKLYTGLPGGTWTEVGEWDPENDGYTGGVALSVSYYGIWGDASGNAYVRLQINDGNKQVLVYDWDTTPVSVEVGYYSSPATIFGLTTDNVFWGGRASNNTGMQLWDGASVSESSTPNIVPLTFWAYADSSSTGTFSGYKASFNGSAGTNRAAAFHSGVGATHALYGESGAVTLSEVSEDPETIADKASLYVKDVSGTAKWHMKDGDGTVTEIGSGSGGDVVEFVWDYLGTDSEIGLTSPALTCYQFDGSGSELNDRTGNGYTLTVGAGTRYYSALGGLKGIWFDGSTHLVGPDTEDLRIVGDVTIEMVCCFQKPATSLVALSCSANGTSAETNHLYHMAVLDTGAVQYNHESGSGGTYHPVDSNSPINNELHYVAITRSVSTNTITFYVDGVIVATDTYTTDPEKAVSGNQQRLRIGSNYDNLAPIVGAVSSVRICNAELTPSQISNVYKEVTYKGTPLTTKGDIYTHDGTSITRLPVGTDDQVLSADSTESTGLKWITSSGGGGGPNLVFNDDHEYQETLTTYQSKHSFRIVKDSANPPASWRVVCSLWITGGGGDTASLEVDVGGDTVEITATELTETVKNGNITITAANDTLLTATVSLKVVGAGGDTAHVKYIDLYAVY